MKTMLKAPVILRLKLKFVEPLSDLAFKFNLHRYTPASPTCASTHCCGQGRMHSVPVLATSSTT